MSTGVLASYEHLDSTVDAIEGLRKAGFKHFRRAAATPFNLILEARKR